MSQKVGTDTTLVVAKSPKTAGLATNLDTLLDFVTPEALNGALQMSRWSIQEEIKALVAIARGEYSTENGDAEPPGWPVRLKAMSELRARYMEALTLSGHIAEVSASRHRTDGDYEIHEEMKSLRAISDSLTTVRGYIDDGVLDEAPPTQGEDPQGET